MCFHSIGDWTGVAKSIGVGGPHQEDVDGTGLQALQHKRLASDVFCQRLPAAARRVTARTQRVRGSGGWFQEKENKTKKSCLH